MAFKVFILLPKEISLVSYISVHCCIIKVDAINLRDFFRTPCCPDFFFEGFVAFWSHSLTPGRTTRFWKEQRFQLSVYFWLHLTD